MRLLFRLATLPISGPIQGSVWVAKKIHEAAETQLSDPGAIRAELSRLERALLAGEISEETYDAAEEILLQRLGLAGS